MNCNKSAKSQKAYVLEACVETIQQAINAENNGANRIELCADLKVGGITPSYGFINLVKELLNIPIFVIIRPRGGNFVYEDLEIEIMKRDIKACINLNVDGLVFGILTDTNQIDLEKTKDLINYTKSIYNL